jgi:hypothetical protein
VSTATLPYQRDDALQSTPEIVQRKRRGRSKKGAQLEAAPAQPTTELGSTAKESARLQDVRAGASGLTEHRALTATSTARTAYGVSRARGRDCVSVWEDQCIACARVLSEDAIGNFCDRSCQIVFLKRKHEAEMDNEFTRRR